MSGESKKTPVLQSDLVIRNNELEQEVYTEKGAKTKILVTVLMFCVVAIAFLIWLAFFHFPQNRFVATSNAAAVCNIAPLSEPFIHHQVVADFAVDAAVGIYTYDHVNYMRQLRQTTDKYLTSDYRDQFMVAFGDSPNLRAVKENYYIVSATTAGRPPVIVKRGLVKGVYTWSVDVPLYVYYTSGRKSDQDKILATVNVIRVEPSPLNPKGIAVSSINTSHLLN